MQYINRWKYFDLFVYFFKNNLKYKYKYLNNHFYYVIFYYIYINLKYLFI